MKKLLLFCLLSIFSNADYLLLTNNHCIYDLSPNQNDTGFCFTDHSDDLGYCSTDLTMNSFIDGYEYIDGICDLKNDLKITGLTQNQWNYQLALAANFIGFAMLFLIGFLSILVSRK